MTALIFVVFMDGRVMTAMLTQIADELGTSVATAGSAVTGYLLTYGVFQLVYGPFADRVGAVPVMSVVSVGLAIAMALAALATGIGTLIGTRVSRSATPRSRLARPSSRRTLAQPRSRSFAFALLVGSAAGTAVLGQSLDRSGCGALSLPAVRRSRSSPRDSPPRVSSPRRLRSLLARGFCACASWTSSPWVEAHP